MLEELSRIFCAMLMTLMGYYIIGKITSKKINIISFKNILLVIILIAFTVILYSIEYTMLYSLTIFLLNIIIYKEMFKISIEESVIACSILMIVMFLSDLITGGILRIFVPAAEIRENIIISIAANILVLAVSVIFVNIKIICLQLKKFYEKIQTKKAIGNYLFLILILIYFSCLTYKIGYSKLLELDYIINYILVIIFCVLTYIFIKSRNNYTQLSDDYDALFVYIQNFEDWIEKEQLNRHEYKNQLAVLRCLTKEKKVKVKIDEILEDNINIEGQAVTNLKNLPKGGIKGLMYYKAAIAQKKKINLTTDVYLEKNSMLTKLSEKDVRVLCKLIGIYFDNAIEAASESRNKNITIEVYELKDRINFAFSNTFKKHKNMKNRNKKGVSSKGEGRGNGLYFASKLIKENSWIEDTQEIIDNYYIQKISIKKSIIQ